MKNIILLAALLMCTGCSNALPPSGSAIEHAAAVNARASTTATAADQAKVDAAAKLGKAAALESAAKADPTPARIAAAVDARVEAALADAVSRALADVAARAAAEVGDAEAKARAERIAIERADDDRHWLLLCRWIGLAATVSGVAAGFVLSELISPAKGIAIGAALAVTGQAVVFYGATITWLPILVGIAGIVALVAWVLEHRNDIHLNDRLTAKVTELEQRAQAVVEKILPNSPEGKV